MLSDAWLYTDHLNVPDHIYFTLSGQDVIGRILAFTRLISDQLLWFFLNHVQPLLSSMHQQLPKSSHLPHSVSQNHAHPQCHQLLTPHAQINNLSPESIPDIQAYQETPLSPPFTFLPAGHTQISSWAWIYPQSIPPPTSSHSNANLQHPLWSIYRPPTALHHESLSCIPS